MNDKKLYKISKQGKITGVSAGLADYFSIDPTVVRVVMVVGAFLTEGILVLIYFIMALILPDRDADKEPIEAEFTSPSDYPRKDAEVDTSPEYNMRNWIGIGLVVVGGWILLTQLFPDIDFFNFDWDYIWPVVLIALGIVILARREKK